jgi:amino acid adenylation domain-containing protein
MSSHARSLISGFLSSVEHYPERGAIEAGGTTLTYQALYEVARTLAATLLENLPSDEPRLTAVFADRSVTAFAGVLGSLMAGHGYVPLNPTFPSRRTNLMLRRSGCRSIIVDHAAQTQLGQVLEGLAAPVLVLMPECPDVSEYVSQWPQHVFVGEGNLNAASTRIPIRCSAETPAYLLFTSGSTGEPKGVAVSHNNVTFFVQTAVERYAINQFDRFSQTFDLTFDLSVFDMFVAWERGACVCCPPRKALLNPAHFIRDSGLTVWFSVPSVALMMKQLGALKPAAFPSLRWSLFCGEALPVELATAWSAAAPSSTLENLYGPTEVTIACTAYRWHNDRSPSESEHNIVPIGFPLRGMKVLIVDSNLCEVPPGQEGELLVSGPQVSLGYWRDPEKTAQSFVTPPGERSTYYRTGDRVCRTSASGPLQFRGRLDHQVKVQGYRVELQEIEAVLREEAGVDVAIAVGWPLRANGAASVEAFLTSTNLDLDTLRERVKARLPRYAVPRRIHLLDCWPLNGNGKIDRGQLIKMLEAGI